MYYLYSLLSMSLTFKVIKTNKQYSFCKVSTVIKAKKKPEQNFSQATPFATKFKNVLGMKNYLFDRITVPPAVLLAG